MSYDVVISKKEQHLKFNKCSMYVWEMLEYLNTIIDESDPDTDLSQLEHALQTAESCRKHYPDDKYDWLHVTALIHDLGKILAVNDKELGLVGDEQWLVVGDNFPVGCMFSVNNVYYHYFKHNKDYNDERYNTKYGIYKPNCGLMNIHMSWGHDEYMYHIIKNQSKLPIESQYICRFHSFYPWHNKGDYMYLCNEEDIKLGLKWVKIFNQFDLYSKSHKCPKWNNVKEYYINKINKYFPNKVNW